MGLHHHQLPNQPLHLARSLGSSLGLKKLDERIDSVHFLARCSRRRSRRGPRSRPSLRRRSTLRRRGVILTRRRRWLRSLSSRHAALILRSAAAPGGGGGGCRRRGRSAATLRLCRWIFGRGDTLRVIRVPGLADQAACAGRGPRVVLPAALGVLLDLRAGG